MDTSIVTLGNPCARLCARVRPSLTASTQICDFCFRTRIRARGQSRSVHVTYSALSLTVTLFVYV